MRTKIITIIVLTIFGVSNVHADDLVKFETAAVTLGKLQQQRNRDRGLSPTSAPEEIEGYIARPEGAGPFAAVVYLHGCSGLSEGTRTRIGKLLLSWGYVSLVVDSFATRGIKQACDSLPPARRGDAIGAINYLSQLSYVDPKRIAVIGASQGGIAALELASALPADVYAAPAGLTFKAVVAYYPFCESADDQLAIPTLILNGELDDWSPAEACERLMKRRGGRGAPVKLVIYPGAHHSFDVPSLEEGKKIFGHWIKYDADAAASSIVEIHDFLASELNR